MKIEAVSQQIWICFFEIHAYSLFSVVFPMYILLSQVAKPTGEFVHLKSTV